MSLRSSSLCFSFCLSLSICLSFSRCLFLCRFTLCLSFFLLFKIILLSFFSIYLAYISVSIKPLVLCCCSSPCLSISIGLIENPWAYVSLATCDGQNRCLFFNAAWFLGKRAILEWMEKPWKIRMNQCKIQDYKVLVSLVMNKCKEILQ